MDLILVKHSISNHNPDQPPAEWGLTAEGATRCQHLAEHLAPFQPQRLFASPMPKALHTAQHVAQALGDLPVSTHPHLHEHIRETNAPYFETVNEFRAIIKASFDQPDQLIFGDETATQAQSRFATAVNEVLATASGGENVIIIAHGYVISLFVALHNTLDIYDLWQQLTMPSFVVLSRPDFTLKHTVPDAGIPPTV